jgi:hypothetical protein
MNLVLKEVQMYYPTARSARLFLACLMALCLTTSASTAGEQKSGRFAGKMNEDITVLEGTVKVQADKDREIYKIYIQWKGQTAVANFETRFLNRQGEVVEPKDFRFDDRVEVEWEIGEIPGGATGNRAVVLKNLSR